MVPTDLNAYIKAVASLAPVAGTGSAQNGAGVDRQGYASAVAIVPYTTSGGVTGGTIKVKVEHSSESGANFTAFSTEETKTIGAGPNETGVIAHEVNLAGAKRYIRVVIDSDPSGGSPASLVAAVVVLGGASALPAA